MKTLFGNHKKVTRIGMKYRTMKELTQKLTILLVTLRSSTNTSQIQLSLLINKFKFC